MCRLRMQISEIFCSMQTSLDIGRRQGSLYPRMHRHSQKRLLETLAGSRWTAVVYG